MLDELTRWRRDLHAMPEVGLDLPKTQSYLRAQLKGLGGRLDAVAGSGLSLFFDLGFREAVAFRADMDALAIAERSDVPYRSAHGGAMHACGHDAHMAMMLAFAHWVDRHRDRVGRNVLLMFQPGEECCGGGQIMADTGILEAHGAVRVFALHVDPHLRAGQVGSRPGPFMARPSEVKLTVRGRSSHVGRPGEGIDALAAGVLFYDQVREMVDGYEGRDPTALKFGYLRAGSAPNVVADELTLWGSLRTFADEDFAYLKRRAHEIAAEVGRETGAGMALRVDDGFPPVINDAALYERAVAALDGMDFVRIQAPVLMGEDFSCFMRRVPGLMLYIGVGDAPPLHAPTFDFDERALLTGVEVLERLCLMD